MYYISNGMLGINFPVLGTCINTSLKKSSSEDIKYLYKSSLFYLNSGLKSNIRTRKLFYRGKNSLSFASE